MKKFKKLFFIDDDQATNVYHKIIVNRAEICEEAVFFDSAEKALETYIELKKDPDAVLPDYIFLDINMPIMDGWQFIQEFERLHINDQQVIIMLTTSLSKSDRDKANNFGFVQGFWSKPMNVEMLNKLIQGNIASEGL